MKYSYTTLGLMLYSITGFCQGYYMHEAAEESEGISIYSILFLIILGGAIWLIRKLFKQPSPDEIFEAKLKREQEEHRNRITPVDNSIIEVEDNPYKTKVVIMRSGSAFNLHISDADNEAAATKTIMCYSFTGHDSMATAANDKDVKRTVAYLDTEDFATYKRHYGIDGYKRMSFRKEELFGVKKYYCFYVDGEFDYSFLSPLVELPHMPWTLLPDIVIYKKRRYAMREMTEKEVKELNWNGHYFVTKTRVFKDDDERFIYEHSDCGLF